MAAIWELPVVFVIENNHYGMGTADRRAAKSAQYYTRGDYIPGVWVDGMDALSVKSATAFAKQYVLQHGPLMLEMVSLAAPHCVLLTSRQLSACVEGSQCHCNTEEWPLHASLKHRSNYSSRSCTVWDTHHIMSMQGCGSFAACSFARSGVQGYLHYRIDMKRAQLWLACRTHTGTMATQSRIQAAHTARATKSRAFAAPETPSSMCARCCRSTALQTPRSSNALRRRSKRSVLPVLLGQQEFDMIGRLSIYCHDCLHHKCPFMHHCNLLGCASQGITRKVAVINNMMRYCLHIHIAISCLSTRRKTHMEDCCEMLNVHCRNVFVWCCRMLVIKLRKQSKMHSRPLRTCG